ncbi:MAG: GIY-YIG nuclease family protein [bacterium]
MYYVYILKSAKDGNFYTGCSKDLKRRIDEHNHGKVESTKNRKPLALICYEAYIDKETAEKREKFLKTSDGKLDINRRLKKYKSIRRDG